MLPEERFPAWAFTESFVQQLLALISIVPSQESGGIPIERSFAFFQPFVPGSRRSIGQTIECLEVLGLVSVTDGNIARTRYGNTIRRGLRSSQTSEPLVRAIIHSGLMADQIRALRTVLMPSTNLYTCSRYQARVLAPQLLGLLARLPDVVITGEVRIGSATSRDIDSLWSELLPSSRIGWTDGDRRRKAIGDRAESYSIEYERSVQIGAQKYIIWVSRDDDSLGYDIDVVRPSTRHIEVKGSTGRDVIFFLTAREWDVANRDRHNYEIQFWGTINLANDPRADYERLRIAGYPIHIYDPFVELRNDPWTMAPDRYRVSIQPGTDSLAKQTSRPIVELGLSQ